MNVSFSVKKIEDISKEVILFEDGEMIPNFLGIIVDKKNMEEIIESLIPGIIPEIVDDEIITVKETMKLLNVSYKTLNKLNLKPVNINGKQRKYRKKRCRELN